MPIYPKDFFDMSAVPNEPGTCFVLMPFGEPYDEIYREVIKECLDDNNLTSVERSETQPTR